jgi:AcrR family transcriptional regulator
MTTVVRPYKGVSAEERRAERRTRLVQACLEVVAAEGILGTSAERVCAEAQLTKRYFYESFPDRDALLLAAADEMFATLRERMEQELPRNRSRRERTHAMLTVLIDTLSEDPRLARLYVESPGNPVLQARREQAITSFTEFAATAVLTDDGPAAPDPGRLLATRVLTAGITDVITSWWAGTLDADRDVIIETLERLASAV